MCKKHTFRTIWHDDVIKWKQFPCYCPFVRGIHRSRVNSPHKSQWRGALTFSLICAWINGWVNNREAGDLRRHRALYDVIVMIPSNSLLSDWSNMQYFSTPWQCSEIINIQKEWTLWYFHYPRRPCGPQGTSRINPRVISRVSCQKGPICHA